VMVRLELYIFDDGMVAMGVSIWWWKEDDERRPEDHRTTGGDGSWLQRWIHGDVRVADDSLVPRAGVAPGGSDGTAHLDGAP
jgi:hypothetical protein